jgi:hypothetical protein
MRNERNTGITTIIGPSVKRIGSAFEGTISSLKISFKPSANGAKIPSGPMYSGPIRCCAAAETFRSIHTAINTATVDPTKTISIGRGIHTALAAPAGIPKPWSDSIKVPCKSIPEFIVTHSPPKSQRPNIFAITSSVYLPIEV